MTERMMTLHPEGKQGVNIDRDKYEAVRNAIVDSLQENGEMTFRGLASSVERKLDDFDGSPMWYTTTVKLDLEARGVIERLPGGASQRVRLSPTER
ncbi:MAG TPA: hypothetical protein VLC95_02475 [Anaerolineae bacterium]|nr:hypothetical protein [Anaerolineae bacterium]